MIGDLGQHLAQIGFGIEAIEFRRTDSGCRWLLRARRLHPIPRTSSPCAPGPRRAKSVRRRCCRSRCVHLLYSASARPSAPARSESPPWSPTSARASIGSLRTTAAVRRGAAGPAPGGLRGVVPADGRESDLRSHTVRRSGAVLPVLPGKRALVPDRPVTQ
jgi:hypothetical protein